MKEKLLKGLKFFGKQAITFLTLAAGYGAATTASPIAIAILGGQAIASAISANAKDGKGSKGRRAAMAIINLLANNVGKAKNDTRINK